MLGRSKPVMKTGRIGQAEPGADVVAGLGVGGRGAGQDGDAGEEAAQLPELHVLGAEVVAPLAHAVGLVDGEEGDAGMVCGGCGAVGTSPRRLRVAEPAQALEEALGHERLGGDVQEVEPPAVEVAQDGARLVGVE